jgi:hypothetical protein
MASVDGVESFPPPNNMASVRRGALSTIVAWYSRLMRRFEIHGP